MPSENLSRKPIPRASDGNITETDNPGKGNLAVDAGRLADLSHFTKDLSDVVPAFPKSSLHQSSQRIEFEVEINRSSVRQWT
ncbi:MAG: hypothetical protein U5K35_07235 [Rhodohalobacter sp.]|nr:hypothetical protein [Rhodohalobacter sp.]